MILLLQIGLYFRGFLITDTVEAFETIDIALFDEI